MHDPGLSRRKLLRAAGVGALAVGLAGCSRRAAAERPVVATYITSSYDDLYPGIELGLNTANRDGHFDFDTFDSGTLLGAEQLIPGLLEGVADLVFQTSSYVSASFPILGSLELPFAAEDYEKHRRACDPAGPVTALINQVLARQNLRVLGGMSTGFEYFWTVHAPIRTPADVRGLRLRVPGPIEGETVKALGGAPVFLGSAEVYEALERGTIDGLVSYVGTVVSRDLHRIVRYGTVAPFGSYTVDAYCRADWYDALSPQRKNALKAAGRVLYGAGSDVLVKVHNTQYLPEVKRAGVNMIELDDAGRQPFREQLARVHQRWQQMLGDPTLARHALDLIRSA